MSELKCVLIAAGGTGGHVFPGLAVANYLREQGVSVHWLGTQQGIEARIIPQANLPLHWVTIKGLRGKSFFSFVMAPFKIAVAVWQSIRVIHRVKPDLVLGMGGFVSGPAGLASWLMRRPLVIHEQNATAGVTNKVLALMAKRVLVAFKSAFKPGAHVVMVGNPVRVELEGLPIPAARLTPPRSPFHLLVLGGSLGAQALNDVLPRALAQLEPADRPLVMHQAGDKHFSEAKKAYESSGVSANIVPFVQEMASAYSWADMVVCRAGALTVAELCAVGLGAVFVPYPHAVDDHQTANAKLMVDSQAALCVAQTELTDARLASIVREFTQLPAKRLAMAEAAYQLRQVKVAEKIYTICQEIVR